jgi:hypothetical protein
VEDVGDVVILAHHHDRQVPLTGIRHGDGRPLTQVHDRGVSEGVTVHPDHHLIIDIRGLTACRQR